MKPIQRLSDFLLNPPLTAPRSTLIVRVMAGGVFLSEGILKFVYTNVAPPKIDQWGPGARVPAIVISPFAKRGYVDSTVYDTTSITALIEHRWGLAPLGTRDANAADLTHALDLGR